MTSPFQHFALHNAFEFRVHIIIVTHTTIIKDLEPGGSNQMFEEPCEASRGKRFSELPQIATAFTFVEVGAVMR